MTQVVVNYKFNLIFAHMGLWLLYSSFITNTTNPINPNKHILHKMIKVSHLCFNLEGYES